MIMMLVLACDPSKIGEDWETGRDGEVGETASGGGDDTGLGETVERYPGTDVEADCLGEPGSRWILADDQEHATRMISVEEAVSDGVITVDVQEDVPLDLILMSARVVQWEVSEATPGTVQRVLVNSIEAGSDAEVPEGVELTTQGGPESWEVGYNWFDPNVQETIPLAEAALGATLSSFHGCGAGDVFTVVPSTEAVDTSGRPDCEDESSWSDLEGPDTSWLLERCPALAEDQSVCLWTSSDLQVQATGLESGESCVVTSYVASNARGGSSDGIAWVGRDLYVCSSFYNAITRVSLEEGSAESALSWCGGVAWYDEEELMILSPTTDMGDTSPLQSVSSWDQAACGAAEDWRFTLPDIADLAIEEGTLYWMDERIDVIHRLDLESGISDEDLALDLAYTSTNPFSVTGGGERLVYGGTNALLVYDTGSGELLETLELDSHPGALTCFDLE